jgi:hypothetical protein
MLDEFATSNVITPADMAFCRYVAAVKARRRDWWLSYL